MVERQRRLEVECVSISSNYPVLAMLIHTLVSGLLAVGWSAGVELNNKNNCSR